MEAGTIPVTGVDDLDEHLDELLSDPELPSNAKLFDNVELQVNDANSPPLMLRLLPKITEILIRYQQDPTALCTLAIKLLGPLSFTQIFAISEDMEGSIIQALRSPAPSANLLAMAVLAKASKSPSEAVALAVKPMVVTNFVMQWLSAPQVEVGEKGSQVLLALLDVDCNTRPQGGLPHNGMEIAIKRPLGQGYMWKRIFHDRDTYGLLLALCNAGAFQKSARKLPQQISHQLPQVLSKQQLSLAHGRILRVMPQLAALNLAAVSRPEPELNEFYLGKKSDEGILQFAALRMVDKSDMLMHLNLIDFFETFLTIQRITPYSTYKMETLKKLVHAATAKDDALKAALLSLPDRTVPEEAGELRSFLADVLRP